jgi:hypothetical protein
MRICSSQFLSRLSLGLTLPNRVSISYPVCTFAVFIVLTNFLGKPGRLVFFYLLLDSILDRLKSIICPYFSHVFDNSINLLKHVKSGQVSHDLWILLVSSLQKLFIHDKNGFMTSERFKAVVVPLVNQIDLVKVDAANYRDRMDLLVSTLGHLASSTRDDKLWKLINHEVMMKSRSEHVPARLTSLRCLEFFYDSLGEEFLILFPETIPFLAELLEDDDADVEKLAHQVCAVIEKYLGEPMSNYL